MALKYCPECGNKVPENAKFCPDCGYKLEIPEEPTITPEPEVIESEVIEEPETTQSRPPIDMVDVKDVKSPKKTAMWAVLGFTLCFIGGFCDPLWLIFPLLMGAIGISIYNIVRIKRWIPLSIFAIVLSIIYILVEVITIDNKNVELEQVQYDGVEFYIPKGYTKEENKDAVTFAYSDNKTYCGVIITHIDYMQYLPNSEIEPLLVDVVNGVFDSKDYPDFILTIENVYDTEVVNDGDYVEIIKNASGKLNSKDGVVHVKCVYRPGYNNIACVISLANKTSNKYLDVEDKILNSIEILGNSTSTTSSTGVSKEVKEFVDGFEAFFNKYVDVMESIASGNNLSAIADYATLLSEYAEWMEKIDEFESKDMTAEDSKYFWDAYARVMSKLTSAGLSDK